MSKLTEKLYDMVVKSLPPEKKEMVGLLGIQYRRNDRGWNISTELEKIGVPGDLAEAYELAIDSETKISNLAKIEKKYYAIKNALSDEEA